MKTLTFPCKSLLTIFTFFASMLFFTANAQERRGGGEGRKGERGGGVISPSHNPGIERRREVVRAERNMQVPNTTRQHRNDMPARPSVSNRPRMNAPRSQAVANRPIPSVANRPRYGTVNRPAYRPVYGYGRPVYSARNPAWRYGFLPRRNSYFYGLPSTYINISFGGIGYRYWDGVFYRPYNNLFTVVAPPIGIFITTLPVGYRTIYVRDYPYYYYNGIYYDKTPDQNYRVVSPPVGAVVESLPPGYETVVIDGETYYTLDGAQYKPVIKENGEIWYEVIKAN